MKKTTLLFAYLLCLTLSAWAQTRTYIAGADISWLTEMEQAGRSFYANASMTDAVEGTQLMKDLGMHAIRLRVWVDPTNTTDGYCTEAAYDKAHAYCDKADVVLKAQRAEALGMDLLIDFHYSDSWADPSRQYIPYAWRNYTFQQMLQAVTDHTTEVLQALRDAGVTRVKWVQIGNETRDGMLYMVKNGTSKSQNGGNASSTPAQFAQLISAGHDAVKAVYPDAITMIHHDMSHSWNNLNWLLNILKTNNARYDMVGLSLYPDIAWDGSTQLSASVAISRAFENVGKIYSNYQKESMIVEVGVTMDQSGKSSAANSTTTTGANNLSSILQKLQQSEHCQGIFYWEPMAWWWNSYARGAFNVGDYDSAWNVTKMYPNAIFDTFSQSAVNAIDEVHPDADPVGAQRQKPGIPYDLQGRPLGASLTRGISIEGGRKVIKH